MASPVITLAASKGGVGKSTLAAALAVRATKTGINVAVLDWEPQGSLTLWWALRGRPENPRVVQDFDDPATAIARLSNDWVIVDTPPANLDRIAQAIKASTVVIIPVRASLFDIAAVREVVTICEEHGKPFGFVLNGDEPRRVGLRSSSLDALEKMGPVLGTPIQNRSVYVSALNTGKTGPEHKDKKQALEAAAEIDALWDAVKAMLAKVEGVMTERDEDDNVFAALEKAYRVAPEVSGVDPKARRDRERRHALRPDDGRRARATGRTAQFNVKMKPDLKRRIIDASRTHDKAISVLAEQAFEALLSKLGKKGGDA